LSSLRESQIEISPNYISQVQSKLFMGGSNAVTPHISHTSEDNNLGICSNKDVCILFIGINT